MDESQQSPIPQDFKDKVDEVLAMCDDAACYQYLSDKVEEKSEDYETDAPTADATKPADDSGVVKQFSMDDAPSNMD